MMWMRVLCFLFTITNFKYRSISVPTDCAKPVQRCPDEIKIWVQKGKKFACAKNEGYVCLRDSRGYLFETCMTNFTVRANTGNCPVLSACVKRKPYLGSYEKYYKCPEEISGCPPKNHKEYSIHHLYKYQRCIESNHSDEQGSESRFPIQYTTMANNYQVHSQLRNLIAVGIALLALIIVFIVPFMIYTFFKKHKCGYHIVNGDEENQSDGDRYKRIMDLQLEMIDMNESESDQVDFIHLKPRKPKIGINEIYVERILVDESKENANDSSNALDFTPQNMFSLEKGKPARFVFMLGEAGYGKTIQCQHITKSWCKARRKVTLKTEDELTDLQNALKEYDFLYFVQMRDIEKECFSLSDMIEKVYRRYRLSEDLIRDIRQTLIGEHWRCLILLDGLDEWNISDDTKKLLEDECIPNCRNLPNCTVLITMRSWKFMEVQKIYRRHVDTVIRLNLLNEQGLRDLTDIILSNCIQCNSDSDEIQDKDEKKRTISEVLSSSPELKSLMEIPLLAVFGILAWHEGMEKEHYSLKSIYLSLVEELIKRSTKKEQTSHGEEGVKEMSIESSLSIYPWVQRYLTGLVPLGKIAFEDLISKSTASGLTLKQLHRDLGKDTYDLFLAIGLLSTSQTSDESADKFGIRFLHKTIQEFVASLYLFNQGSVASLVEKITSIDKALELSNVLVFVSGLSPKLGCELSKHITTLSSADDDICKYREYFSYESYQKVFHLYDLQLKCYREVREFRPISCFKDNDGGYEFSISDVILLSNDTDKLAMRESADILYFHANDIKSLHMVCIPDDKENGITNAVLKTFLDKSKSIESLCIEGYDKGRCRFFETFSSRLSNLRTLGLSNVAFSDNVSAILLTNEESKKTLRALGLFYIKSADNLDVDFEYQFPSIHYPSIGSSGFVQKRKYRSSSTETQFHTSKQKSPSIQTDILKHLPYFNSLAALHVSYMDSSEDREKMLEVLPEIRSLVHFGYHGTSIYPNCNKEYDARVIQVLLKNKQIKILYFNQINLKGTDQAMDCKVLSDLERITLQQFEMHELKWKDFITSITEIKNLCKVALNDTDIKDNVYIELTTRMSSKVTVVRGESGSW